MNATTPLWTSLLALLAASLVCLPAQASDSAGDGSSTTCPVDTRSTPPEANFECLPDEELAPAVRDDPAHLLASTP